MANNALPLLVAGGAALLLLSGKKKGRSSKSTATAAPSPYGGGAAPGPGAPGSPAPAPAPSKPTATKDEDLLEPIVIEQMLLDLGYPPGAVDGAYDADTVTAIETFQMDWNSLMEWLWKHNPNISKGTPRYGKIGEDGKWGPQTESRAVRALDTVGVTGDSFITIGDDQIPVDNFRDMVLKSYQALPV